MSFTARLSDRLQHNTSLIHDITSRKFPVNFTMWFFNSLREPEPEARSASTNILATSGCSEFTDYRMERGTRASQDGFVVSEVKSASTNIAASSASSESIHRRLASENRITKVLEGGFVTTEEGAVTWSEKHPHHPRSWSLARKLYDTGIMFALELFTTLISNTGVCQLIRRSKKQGKLTIFIVSFRLSSSRTTLRLPESCHLPLLYRLPHRTSRRYRRTPTIHRVLRSKTDLHRLCVRLLHRNGYCWRFGSRCGNHHWALYLGVRVRSP